MAQDKSFPWFTDKAEQKLFDKLDFACVYAIGADDSAVRIGWCGNPHQKLAKMQPANWRPLKLLHVQWTAGAMLATRLQKEVARVFRAENMEILGDWFRIKTDEIEPAIQSVADAALIPSFQHDEMLERVRTMRRRQIERAMQQAGLQFAAAS